MTVLFTAQARKAWAGAGIAFLSPLSVLLLTTSQPLTLRLIMASVISGLMGGFAVFQTRNKKVASTARRSSAIRPSMRGRHEKTEEFSSPPLEGFDGSQ